MAQLVRFLLISILLLGVDGVRADTTWVSGGAVSGAWEAAASPYMILGNIHIPPQHRLDIAAGVTVFFTGHYGLVVDGALYTSGAEDAPVVFTADTLVNPEGWAGIWIFDPADSCALRQTVLEYGRALGPVEWGLGGALLLDGARLSLEDCTIRYCRANSGHAIFARRGTRLTIRDSWIYRNGRDAGSGAITCTSQSELTITGSQISNNFALYGGGIDLDNTVAVIRDSEIAKNTALVWGGGIYGRESVLTLTGSVLAANNSIGGGGIDGRANLDLVMDSCLVVGNSAMRIGAQGYGGGLNLQSGEHQITRVTFAGNQAPTAAALNCGPATRVRNSIFALQAEGGCVQFNYPGADVRYCCFGGNAYADYTGANAPPEFGRAARVNLNGDSCDAYSNLFADPQFSDSADETFSLAPSSPCVDAGDPLLPHDADGTVSDMGMRPLVHAAALTPRAALLPDRPALAPAYPNPFNPLTTLAFDLPRAGVVSLRVYDVAGREVTTLLEGRRAAGHHLVTWDATALPSGPYYALLCAGDLRAAQRLLLLK